MDYPKITKLYKYTSFNARSISTLVTEKLWFPKPNTINDPFDCTIVNHSKGLLPYFEIKGQEHKSAMSKLRPDKSSQNDIEKKIYPYHDKFLTTITEQDKEHVKMCENAYDSLQSHIYNFGVLSLSATPKSILMWSHYGEHHNGICFEFERHENNKLGTDAKPVTYSGGREINDPKISDETRDLFFLKYCGWRYEREWRLLETKGNQFYDFPGKLTSVICGALMPFQNIETVTTIVNSLNVNRVEKISVGFARLSEKKYSITISKPTNKRKK